MNNFEKIVNSLDDVTACYYRMEDVPEEDFIQTEFYLIDFDNDTNLFRVMDLCYSIQIITPYWEHVVTWVNGENCNL